MKKAHSPAARMTAVSDAMVLGVVLGLVFAAVSYYLYSMIGQLTRKVNVMENILLDLKVTTEQTLLSATELPESHPFSSGAGSSGPNSTEVREQNTTEASESTVSPSEVETYRTIVAETTAEPQSETSQQEPFLSQNTETRELNVDTQTTRARGSASTVQVEREKSTSSATTNYEAMKYAELLQLAKSKGLNVSRGTTTKNQVIELLRASTTSQPETRQGSGLESWTTSGVLSFDENGTDLAQGGPSELSDPELTLVGSE
jgi:hypothetical protein